MGARALRRVAAFLLALAALAGAARGAEHWIAAFGDSITHGCCDSWPAGPGQSWGPLADSGYPERLAELLGCVYFEPATPTVCPAGDPYPACAVVNPPGNCALANRGVSGERATVEGVTRIDTVLAEWPWDVIVLMMGTNDLGISTATIKDALELIDEKAADQGVDVVHAPVVELHPYALNYNPICQGVPGYNPRPWLEPARKALRLEVIDIAATRNRYLSDQSERVCPDAGLDFHGHTRFWCQHYDYGEKCGVGHPSGSSDNPALGASAWEYDGYDNMASGFLADLTTIPLPGTADPTSPVGGVCGAPTSFDWTKESNETATWYRVEIDGGAYAQWHPEWDWRPAEVDLCQPDGDPDDACSLPSPLVLGTGSHSWRVRGRNPGGHGPWSAATSFEVYSGAPGAAVPSHPEGSTFDTTPIYGWEGLTTATEYDLEVFDGSAWVTAGTYDGSACSATACVANPAVPVLTPGPRKFRLRGSNPCGAGPLSVEGAFTVLDCASYPDLFLEDTVVSASATELACGKITAGNLGTGDYVIDGVAADVVFQAGSSLEIHNGFSLLRGSFTGVVSP